MTATIAHIPPDKVKAISIHRGIRIRRWMTARPTPTAATTGNVTGHACPSSVGPYTRIPGITGTRRVSTRLWPGNRFRARLRHSNQFRLART